MEEKLFYAANELLEWVHEKYSLPDTEIDAKAHELCEKYEIPEEQMKNTLRHCKNMQKVRTGEKILFKRCMEFEKFVNASLPLNEDINNSEVFENWLVPVNQRFNDEKKRWERTPLYAYASDLLTQVVDTAIKKWAEETARLLEDVNTVFC